MWRGWCVLLGLSFGACAVDDHEIATGSVQQAGMQMQGMQMQGMQMQGMQMQGMQMQGFQLGGATISGDELTNLHVDKGEVVADHAGVTLHGDALVGAHLWAQAQDPITLVTVLVEYRVTAVTPESSSYDPTHTGSTYLYSLDQWVADTMSWQPACSPDYDGRSVAIPLAATWDATGSRVYSPAMFTFGCTTGVIAKCYRWGYRPWVTGYGNLDDLHWTCTRLARADYCGDGIPHTRDGTTINVWDKLPPPGPIQKHGLLPPLGMLFEAGWNTSGAVCLSHARWLLDDGLVLASVCPDHLIPPGLLGATVCDTVAGVLGYDPNAKLFNESYLHLGL